MKPPSKNQKKVSCIYQRPYICKYFYSQI